MRNYRLTTSFHSSFVQLIFLGILCQNSRSQKQFEVGVVLDMGSWNGKMIDSCITMAVSDFYNINAQYKTRIVLQISDSTGDPKELEATLDIVAKNVEAMIVVPEISLDAKLLALISDKAKVPIISLSGSVSSSDEHPYFLQISQSRDMQFKAIATIVESFQWITVIFICEDTDYNPGVLSYLFEYFKQKNIQIDYISSLPSKASDHEIHEELHKLMNMQTKIFVLHMTPSLASRFLLSVKKLGMMSEGYAWILTDKTSNLLQYMNSEEVMKSMQGSLALKPYVPPSIKLKKFNSRWRKNYQNEYSYMSVKEPSVYGLWAYDAIWALARAVEGADTQLDPISSEGNSSEFNSTNNGVSQIGKVLLTELSKTRFKGLSGDFQIVNSTIPVLTAFEIVNLLRRGERRVGFWPKGVVFYRDIMRPAFNHDDLEVIIWPGGSKTTPRGAWPLMKMDRRKLRVGVPGNASFKEFINLEHDPKTNKTKAMGFCVDVFEAALNLLPYELHYEYIPFVDANGKRKGTYNDLVYQVYLENYDTVVGDVSITHERSLYVDFTTPYTDIGVGTIARVKSDKDMWIFTKPIGVDLCLMTAVIFVLTGTVIWVIEKPTNKEFQGSPSEQIGKILFATLFFSNRENLSSNLSRFVMLIWTFLVLILTSSYTATLTSMLTVQQIGYASKGGNVGYQVGSFVEGNMKNNLNFVDYRLRPYNSAKEYAEALSKGSKNNGSDGIIDEMPYIKSFLSQYAPDYAMVDSEPTTNGFGFAFRKGSPLVSEISRAIANLRENRTLQTLEEKWYKKAPSLLNQETMSKPQVLEIQSFGGLFLITGVCLGLALLVIIYYIICRKLNILNYLYEKLANGNLVIMIVYLFRSELREMPM